MVRAMRRAILVLLCLAGCERAEPTVAERRELQPLPVDPIDSVVADTLTYVDQLPGILIAFDGDCGAHATRLLTLEPLVASIRKRSEELRASRADADKVLKDRLMTHKTETLGKLDDELRAKGLTRADVEAKERAVKAACDADPRVKDAMDRVGLFKKKT